jgi:hypothetical protein
MIYHIHQSSVNLMRRVEVDLTVTPFSFGIYVLSNLSAADLTLCFGDGLHLDDAAHPTTYESFAFMLRFRNVLLLESLSATMGI